MFRTPVDGFFPNFLRAQNMVRVIEGKIYGKWPEGKRKLYDGNPGEIDFGSS